MGGNPETLTDPSGHCAGADGICHRGHDPYNSNKDTTGNSAPTVSNFGTTADTCSGYAHCVIFIDGPNVLNADNTPNLNKTEDSFATQKKIWLAWESFYNTKYNGDVGFIFMEAPDSPQGAAQIQATLHDLHGEGYVGTVGLVGHSNGASAILRYFANEESTPTNDAHVNNFVLLDAPAFGYMAPMMGAAAGLSIGMATGDPVGGMIVGLGLGLTYEAAKMIWQQGSPNFDAGAASEFIQANGIQGVYAYNGQDMNSGPLSGAWQTYVGWTPGDPIYGAHVQLETNPDQSLQNMVAATL